MRKIKKKLLLLLLIAAILTGLGLFTSNYHPTQDISAAERLSIAVDMLKNCKNLSYSSSALLKLPDSETLIANLTGEICSNNYHTKGELLGSPLDIYQLGNSTYRLDNPSGKWLITDENEQIFDTALFNEINPLTAFEFIDYGDPVYTENTPKRSCTIQFSPTVNDNYLDTYFIDLDYLATLQDNWPIQVDIAANLKNSSIEGELLITYKFEQLTDDYCIEPPVSK